jgi:hypothetical protein
MPIALGSFPDRLPPSKMIVLSNEAKRSLVVNVRSRKLRRFPPELDEFLGALRSDPHGGQQRHAASDRKHVVFALYESKRQRPHYQTTQLKNWGEDIRERLKALPRI